MPGAIQGDVITGFGSEWLAWDLMVTMIDFVRALLYNLIASDEDYLSFRPGISQKNLSTKENRLILECRI